MADKISRNLGLAVISLGVFVICLAGVARSETAPSVEYLGQTGEGLSVATRIALDGDGDIFVTDNFSQKVLHYGKTHKLIGAKQFPLVVNGIAATADGKLLITQFDKVEIRDRNFTLLGMLGRGPGQFACACGITIDAEGYIYVVDSYTAAVQVFTPAGVYAYKFAGVIGDRDSEMIVPTGIAFEKASGQLAVVDTGNGRIQFFDRTGKFIKKIGMYGVNALQFLMPHGVAFQYDKNLETRALTVKRMYVTDTRQSWVQVIDPNYVSVNPYTGVKTHGRFLAYFGDWDGRAGEMVMPIDLVFDEVNSRVLVTNAIGFVSIYGIDGGKSPTESQLLVGLTLNPLPAYSNTPAQILSGTVDSGASVTVTNATSGATAAAIVNGTTWSCQIPLVAGGNSLAVTAAKSSYLAAGASAVVILDAVLPELSVSAPAAGSYTNVQTHTISGSASDANLGQVTVNGRPVVVTGGAFTTTLTLAVGANTITVAASDLAGNVTADSRSVIYDATAPVLTVSALTDGSYTNNPTQNITGTVAEANLDQVTVNGQPVPVVNGVFSTSITLNIGANTITVAATDLAGNSAGDSRAIIFDNTAPAITITAPADGSYTREGTAAISGSVDETVTYVDVNGTGAQMNGTAWSSTVSLAQGLNTLEIVAMDLAGNIGSAKRSVIYDNIAPQVAITTPNQDLATSSAAITVSGTASDSEPFTLAGTAGGAASALSLTDGAWSMEVTFPAEGSWPIIITATDAAGNASSAIRTVTYDTTPPALTLDPANTARPAKLTGTVEPGAVVVVQDKNGMVSDKASVTAGAWSADLSAASYDVLSLAAVATDAAGNRTIRALAFQFPDGDLDGDGTVTLKDFQIAQQIWNQKKTPTAAQLAHGDIGPLLNGLPCPDGTIDKTDAELIQQKASGKLSW